MILISAQKLAQRTKVKPPVGAGGSSLNLRSVRKAYEAIRTITTQECGPRGGAGTPPVPLGRFPRSARRPESKVALHPNGS